MRLLVPDWGMTKFFVMMEPQFLCMLSHELYGAHFTSSLHDNNHNNMKNKEIKMKIAQKQTIRNLESIKRLKPSNCH